MGVERKTAVRSQEALSRTAYHESGHALVALSTPGASPIHKATIVPRGHALGMVTQVSGLPAGRPVASGRGLPRCAFAPPLRRLGFAALRAAMRSAPRAALPLRARARSRAPRPAHPRTRPCRSAGRTSSPSTASR
jgi:hypothetical protein